jgi:hypothetical protein
MSRRLHILTLCSVVTTLDAFMTRSLFSLTTVRWAPSTPFGLSVGNVADRLDLSDNFNRWRFMQNFLDAEVKASDVNEVLYLVLDSFFKSPPSASDDSNESASPVVTPKVRAIMEELLKQQNRQIAAFCDPECSPGDDDVIKRLEKLLPDPRENEDAFKGSWDTVILLHGRESVKINEGKGTREWKARCVVARVLIYFDFLTNGVPSTTTR